MTYQLSYRLWDFWHNNFCKGLPLEGRCRSLKGFSWNCVLSLIIYTIYAPWFNPFRFLRGVDVQYTLGVSCRLPKVYNNQNYFYEIIIFTLTNWLWLLYNFNLFFVAQISFRALIKFMSLLSLECSSSYIIQFNRSRYYWSAEI